VEGSWEGRVHRRAVGGSFERRTVNASRYFAMVYRMGGMASMLCRGSTGVVRKVPLILRTAMFWATWSIRMRDFGAQWDQIGRP